MELGHALPGPDQDLDLDYDLTSLTDNAASGARHALGSTSVYTDKGGVGEQASDGTIDPYVCVGGNSPDRFEEHASSSARRFWQTGPRETPTLAHGRRKGGHG